MKEGFKVESTKAREEKAPVRKEEKIERHKASKKEDASSNLDIKISHIFIFLRLTFPFGETL